MGFCQLIRVDRVLYDEIIFCIDEETIPINEEVTPGSSIDEENSKVQVTILNCSPVIEDNHITSVTGLLHIIKDVIITRPDLPDLVLEYSFNKEFTCPLSKIEDAFIADEDVSKAVCRIAYITSYDEMTLSPGTEPSFTERLVASIKIKLVVPYEQLFVGTCPGNLSSNAEITIGTIPQD